MCLRERRSNCMKLTENSKLVEKHRKTNYWSKVYWRFRKSNVVKLYYINFTSENCYFFDLKCPNQWSDSTLRIITLFGKFLTSFPGFSQSHWHIISKSTRTDSFIPTGEISKICLHSLGSSGQETTSILAEIRKLNYHYYREHFSFLYQNSDNNMK